MTDHTDKQVPEMGWAEVMREITPLANAAWSDSTEHDWRDSPAVCEYQEFVKDANEWQCCAIGEIANLHVLKVDRGEQRNVLMGEAIAHYDGRLYQLGIDFARALQLFELGIAEECRHAIVKRVKQLGGSYKVYREIAGRVKAAAFERGAPAMQRAMTAYAIQRDIDDEIRNQPKRKHKGRR